MEIYQVAFSRPERRVWREGLDPVGVLMTEAVVAMAGFSRFWRFNRVGYRCVEGNLRSVGGSTLGSEGMLVLGTDEGSAL